MTSGSASPISEPSFRLTGRADSVLVIRLTVHSRMIAPAVVRPEIDDWVLADGGIRPAEIRLSPSHVYLRQGGTARLTLTTRLPADLQPGTVLHGGLRFPGIEDEVLPLALEILPAREEPKPAEHQISVTLPLTGYDRAGGDQADSKAIITLLAGMAGLEVIPARWVVAELIATICERGEAVRKTEEGRLFLAKLSRTRFYKNGALAFRGAHITEWLLVGVSVSSGLHSILAGAEPQGRMLYTWERWLLSLVDTDIEHFEREDEDGDPELHLPPPPLEETLRTLGTDAERWFSSFILGLVQIAPRIRSVLQQLCDEQPDLPEESPQGDKTKESDVLSEGGSLLR